jgi:hypothetical protein
MTQRVSAWIHRASSGWVVFSALVIFILFMIFVLPRQASRAEADSTSTGSPDMSFYYTAEDLYQMADGYGEEGREAYIWARFTFDLIWPLVYAFFLCTGISWVYQRSFAIGSVWQRANIVPVLGAVFDYLENISASVVMARYPNPTAVLDILAPIFTMLKWTFVAGSFALLLVGVFVGLGRWVTARIRKRQ